MSAHDDEFLKFMRDQGAQRAYRNVGEWLEVYSILTVLERIEVELAVIDARRKAFADGKSLRKVQEEQAADKADKIERDQWKDQMKEIARGAKRVRAVPKKPSPRRKPSRPRRRTRSGS